MAEIINMPRLSDTMEEGTVATWLKKVGDKVVEGDILAEIETDKATMEFESFYEGTLLHIGVKEGETTKVDELLAIIGEEDEDISSILEASTSVTETNANIETPKDTSTDTQEEEKSSTYEIPDDVNVITMPRLSDTMEEGTVATWLKKEGDTIEEGDILAEIETDKATMEFESFNNGTLLYIGLQEGETAKVDSLLAVIGPKGVDVSKIVDHFKNQSEAPKNTTETTTKASETIATPKQPTPQDLGLKKTDGRVFVSPLARKIALEKGIDLSQVQGSGDGGRIIKRDIENFKPSTAISESTLIKTPLGQESFEEKSNSQMRKVIAKRLRESKFSAPHYYLNVEFDMDNAISFRTQINSIQDVKISYNDIIIKACALALVKHSQVNSQWFEDKMRLNHHVHIGVAVAVDEGLLVPVLRFANDYNLTDIGNAVKEYAVKARNKKLTPQEMEGSTFTISNLGMFGIESFTSIINQPNSAILSVGAIVEKPVVKNGKIAVGNTMKLTLACDHRTVDGATGALFLQTLKGYIENPLTMLV